MATVDVERPSRGLELLRRESTGRAVAIAATGAAALALVLIGPLAVVGARGFTPLDDLVGGLTSQPVEMLLLGGGLLGLAGMVLGWGFYGRMPTKVSREEAVAGAVLGLQALGLAGVMLWFVNGDVAKFALNYLNFEIVGPLLDEFLIGAWNTVRLAFSGEALGIALGLVLAIFTISRRPVVRAPARTYINFFRGTPLIWQIAFIGTGLPIGLGLDIDSYDAAIIALGLNAGAYTAEVFRAGIQSIEKGQMEAARGLGMSYFQAMRYAILPQAVRRVIPPLMNEFVILIKDTSLVIVLGLTAAERDLMSVGDQATANTFNATFLVMTAIGYLSVSLPLIRVVNAVEKRLRSGLVGVGA